MHHVDADVAWDGLDAQSEARVVVDGEFRIAFVTVPAERLFGRPRSELVGSALAAVLEAHDVEISFERSSLARPPFLVGRVRDAKERTVDDERRMATAADALDDQDRLETMLAFAPALIMAVDLAGRIEFINWVLPQYSRAEVIGMNWRAFIPPESAGVLQAALDAMMATGQPQHYEVSVAGPDGSPVWFASQIGPIRRRGTIVGSVIVSQDVSERKRAQAELLSARRLAVLGTLAAGVAHEINTPVQFIGDSLRFLQDGTNDLLQVLATAHSLRHNPDLENRAERLAIFDRAEEQADVTFLRENIPGAFVRCLDGLQRVTTIVRSLKEFAHPPQKEMGPVDLNQTIQSTLTLARSEYKYLAELQTDYGDLPLVVCHGNEINQVVLNIVINAAHSIGDVVKASGRLGRISVSTRHDGDDVVVAIGDSGAGIPEAVRGRIFDPFFTTKTVGKGTGQGLAIAMATVKDHHGGQLTFETKLGEGTTFFMRLPIAGKPLENTSVAQA